MRVALLAVLLAVPAAAQPLPALTPCCPTMVATVDPVTGESAVIATVGEDTDFFIANVGSVVIDAAGQRGFLVRNDTLTTVDLVTGEITSGAPSFSFVQLAGYDTARDRLLALTSEVAGVTDTSAVYAVHLAAYRLATQDTVRVARVGEFVILTSPDASPPADVGDAFLSVSGPAVADGGRLFTVRNERLLSVDLATGALTEGPPEPSLGELLGYDASADALYRLERRFEVASDTSETLVGVFTRQTAGGALDTLATVPLMTVFNNGAAADGGYLASMGLAVYDAAADRVILNRNGSFLVVDLASGALTEGPEARAGVAGGALSARTVADADAPRAALALRASPNPTRGTVRVAVGAHAWARVEVLDALGRRVARLADGPTAGDVTWDASAAAPGVYRVRVVADGRAATVPVTVAR